MLTPIWNLLTWTTLFSPSPPSLSPSLPPSLPPQVGRALASTEEDAYPILESLDVDYVLVIFGKEGGREGGREGG